MSDNVFGEVLEQGASIGKQTTSGTVDLAKDVAKGFIEGLVGKPVSPKKAQDLKQADDQKKQQNLAVVRSNIKSLMTPKQKPQQQPPPYISGKAGFSIEKIQKMQKLQEDKKKKPPPLPVSVKQAQGSAEIGKFVSG